MEENSFLKSVPGVKSIFNPFILSVVNSPVVCAPSLEKEILKVPKSPS